MEKVFLVKTDTRADAVEKLFRRFDLISFREKKTVVKANYNSADSFPASTHIDARAPLDGESRRFAEQIVKILEKEG